MNFLPADFLFIFYVSFSTAGQEQTKVWFFFDTDLARDLLRLLGSVA